MANFISTTSGNLDPTYKSWVSVVYQTGKPVLDSELNLVQNISQQRSSKPLPSGIVSESPVSEGGENFIYYDISDPNFRAKHDMDKSFHCERGRVRNIYVGGSDTTNAAE